LDVNSRLQADFVFSLAAMANHAYISRSTFEGSLWRREGWADAGYDRDDNSEDDGGKGYRAVPLFAVG
jgi:hypothetical protein